MSETRDKFPIYVGLSILLHVLAVAALTMLPAQRGVTAQETVQRFTLLEPELDTSLSPGGAPLGAPAPAPLGKPAKRKAAPRITHAIPSSEATSPIVTQLAESRPVILQPERIEPASQPTPAIAPTAPTALAAACTQPASSENGDGQGGSETGVIGGRGIGGTGNGGSPDGCIGCKGNQRGRGTGLGDAVDWKKAYKRKVYARIQSAKQYPYAARRAGMEGRVVVRFTVSRAGAISGLSVVTASPYPILNSDALQWVQRACPLPPFPAEAEEATLSFTYGLRYELSNEEP